MAREVLVSLGWATVEQCVDAIAFFDAEYDTEPHDAAFLEVANAYRAAIGQIERKPDHQRRTHLVSWDPYNVSASVARDQEATR